MSPDWRFCHDCCDLGTAGAPVRRTLEVVGRGTGTSERRIAGRVEEQRLLSAAIESAASGEPSAFFVHGEAGAGKTHLVRTVCGQGARNGYAVLWGRCVRFGAVDAPYLPLGNALEGWLEAAEPDERSEVLAAVDGVGELLPSLRQQTSDKPVRLLSVLDELVQALASRRPTILVVDDIQWADPASRDALAYLIAGFRSQRLIMLATLRDEELLAGDPTHGWLADLRRLPAVHDLRLGRLTRDDTEQQLAMLIGGEPLPHLIDAVQDLTAAGTPTSPNCSSPASPPTTTTSQADCPRPCNRQCWRPGTDSLPPRVGSYVYSRWPADRPASRT